MSNLSESPISTPGKPIPSEQPKSAPQSDPKALEANLKARLQELTNVNRIIANGLNLIVGVDIKGGQAGPVAEFLSWLSGFNQSLAGQIKTLESTLPKKEEKKPIVPKASEIVASIESDSQQAKPSKAVNPTYNTEPKSVEPVAKSEPVKAEVK